MLSIVEKPPNVNDVVLHFNICPVAKSQRNYGLIVAFIYLKNFKGNFY